MKHPFNCETTYKTYGVIDYCNYHIKKLEKRLFYEVDEDTITNIKTQIIDLINEMIVAKELVEADTTDELNKLNNYI